MTATTWEHLPDRLRHWVEQRTGTVLKAEPADGGHNHHLAVLLHTDDRVVFLKGTRGDDRRAHRQRYEATTAPAVTAVSPQLLWHEPDAAGWNLLAFQAILGARHADLQPTSPDQPRIRAALKALAAISPGNTELLTTPIEKRWAEHGTAAELAHVAGSHLLHTDLRPDNILIDQLHRDHYRGCSPGTLGPATMAALGTFATDGRSVGRQSGGRPLSGYAF